MKNSKFAQLKLFLLCSMLCNAAPGPSHAAFRETAGGIRFRVLAKGKGEKVKEHHRLYIYYRSAVWPQGLTFDSTAGAPFAYVTAEGEGLKGWDEALSQLQVGDSALFVIPPDLAYGARKVGRIPANSSISFAVKVVRQEEAYYPLAGADSSRLQDGLTKFAVKAGSGRQVRAHEVLTMNFNAYIINEEGHRRTFQSSKTNSNKAIFQLGTGKMVQGLEKGLVTMQVGEKATFRVAPELGFGNTKNGVVPAMSTLYFDIEVLDASYPFSYNPLMQFEAIGNGAGIFKTCKSTGSMLNAEDVAELHCLTYFVSPGGQPVLLANSRDMQQTVILRAGSSNAPPALGEALLHLREGEKAIVTAGAKAIDEFVQRGTLPKGCVLVHEVELLSWKKYPFFITAGLDTISTASGLKYLDVKKPAHTRNQKITNAGISYTGYYADSLGQRRIFDASRENGKLLEYIAGQHKLIAGFEEGLQGMEPGHARHLVIPAALAYGEKGVAEAGIAPNTTLYFDVEMVWAKYEDLNSNQN